MIRPLLTEVLGHIVHARLTMESLQEVIISEMKAGYRPTYRGHAWDQRQYELLDAGAQTIEATFHLLKAVQFPEMYDDRLNSVVAGLENIQKSYRQRGHGHSHTAELLPGDEQR